MYTNCFSVFDRSMGHKLKDWMARIAKIGDYINNPDWTEICLKESIKIYQDLSSWGVNFEKDRNGDPIRENEGVLETLHSGPGWAFLPLLRKQVLKRRIKIIDRVMATDLIKQDGRVSGAVGFDTRSGDFYVFQAKATIMCTGWGSLGISDNIERTGSYDGEAMAYRVGAIISGKEFSNSGGFLTPAVESIGFYADTGGRTGKIKTAGREIKRAPEGWHAPFIHLGRFVDAENNVISPAIMASSIAEGRGPILYDLDSGNPEDIKAMSDQIKNQKTEDLLGFSLVDPAKGGLFSGQTRYEVLLGGSLYGGGSGIWSSDTKGATSLPGLFAAGDCYNSGAIGGVYPCHGFALRNAGVIGARAGRNAAEFTKNIKKNEVDDDEMAKLKSYAYFPLNRAGGFDAEWVTVQIKNTMTPYYVWVYRKGERLEAALTMIKFLNNEIGPRIYARDAHGLRMAHEAKGRLINTEMMLRSAIFRTESRGSHYREDYPQRKDSDWLAWVKIKVKNGQMNLIKEPFPDKWRPDLKIPYKERYPRRLLGDKST
jgi:succinate dehydrogenase/fumarate reductase flavoprotein subunit